jgi:hypothetical protein
VGHDRSAEVSPGARPVHDLGPGRLQPQPDLFHPGGQGGQDLLGLPPGRAVHHRIVGALEVEAGNSRSSHESNV